MKPGVVLTNNCGLLGLGAYGASLATSVGALVLYYQWAWIFIVVGCVLIAYLCHQEEQFVFTNGLALDGFNLEPDCKFMCFR